jgi:hypothetical protein
MIFCAHVPTHLHLAITRAGLENPCKKVTEKYKRLIFLGDRG